MFVDVALIVILLSANKCFSVAPGGPFGFGLSISNLRNKVESRRKTCREHVAIGFAKSQSSALSMYYTHIMIF